MPPNTAHSLEGEAREKGSVQTSCHTKKQRKTSPMHKQTCTSRRSPCLYLQKACATSPTPYMMAIYGVGEYKPREARNVSINTVAASAYTT